jgi:hypothetical protein
LWNQLFNGGELADLRIARRRCSSIHSRTRERSTSSETKGKADLMTTNQAHASGDKTLDTTVTVAEEMSTPVRTMSASQRLMTGEDYIESIRGGREIYLYGDRVIDLTPHAAVRNSVRITALRYGALHDPKTRGPAPRTTGVAAIYIPCGSSGVPARQRTWRAPATRSLPGRGSPMAGWAVARRNVAGLIHKPVSVHRALQNDCMEGLLHRVFT